MKRLYENIIKEIPKNSKVAIWGTSEVGILFNEYIKNLRSDIEVKFFVNSKEIQNFEHGKVITSVDFVELSNEVDTVIITSYSGRIFMENISKLINIQNIYSIDENFLKKEQKYNLDETKEIFTNKKDKELYELLSNFRANPNAFKKDLQIYFINTHNHTIAGYAQNHYFDYINKDAIKTVIDAGGYDCLQSLFFLNKFPNCEKVYTFEPCYEIFKHPLYDAIIKKRNEIEIVEKGIWSKTEMLEFQKVDDIKWGSSINGVKPELYENYEIIKTPVVSIDDFVKENKIKKIDFIKMDIENAEEDAIKGGLETILKDRPQLAISIYHSDEQFFNLPKYLKDVLKDYIFRLGHYSAKEFETVLYAIPKELYMEN